jgi:hypothetical protein
MKFVLLESRGGNYLVIAQNVAWLRTGENGQTNVGIVGSSPLLVSGSIEEVAAKIEAATKQEEQPAAAAPIASPTPVEAPVSATPNRAPVIEVKPQEAEPERLQTDAQPRSTLADRVARAAGPAVKAGSQRLMSISD